jgi:hypothetical protein
MRALRNSSRAKFVSFSGIDGAGKSTQIETLCTRLKAEGHRVLLIRFWDDIAKLTRLREGTGHRIFKGDKGVGSPSTPINRRDKNVRSWFMTGVRLFLYFIDAISVRFVVERALRSKADLVVFDRYIYDELANLPLGEPFIRAYVRLITKFVPPRVSPYKPSVLSGSVRAGGRDNCHSSKVHPGGRASRSQPRSTRVIIRDCSAGKLRRHG